MGKVPLVLDRATILGAADADEPPPELEIVPSAAAGCCGGGSGEGQEMLWNMSDQQISDNIQRLCSLMRSGTAVRLPDKGEKARGRILVLQAELDRRKLVRARKETERNERVMKVESREPSPGIHNDSISSVATSSEEASFARLFSKKLEKRAGSPPNTRWITVSRDKCANSSENGRQMHQGRKQHKRKPAKLSSQPVRTSCRSSPFQCASRLAEKDSDRLYTPSAGQSLLTNFCKRKASDDHTPRLMPKKVQDVVLLDEDEAEPPQPLVGDVPDDRNEAMIYYPSRDDQECVELSYSDLKCLDPEQYLTSPIMNFYIRYLQKPQSLTGRTRGEYHFFNTYFFGKLREAVSCKGDRSARFLKLRRWWKGVNIFQKAYIFLPVHADMHWSLVIICIPAKEDESGPIVLHLDSLGMHPSDKFLDMVESCLEEEWKYLNKEGPPPDLPISEKIWSNLPDRIEKKKLKVPQQKNEYDCGLFVLYFMERFIDEAPERLERKDFAMFGSKWFQPEEASGLRKRIKELLVEEFESARLEIGGGQESTPSPCSSAEEDDVQQLIEV